MSILRTRINVLQIMLLTTARQLLVETEKNIVKSFALLLMSTLSLVNLPLKEWRYF